LIAQPGKGFTALALFGLAACSWQAAAQNPAESLPRILIVNDDGIDSPGVQALIEAMTSIAEVHVCAPDTNRSGACASTMAQILAISSIPPEPWQLQAPPYNTELLLS
jgi:hypothetical protein